MNGKEKYEIPEILEKQLKVLARGGWHSQDLLEEMISTLMAYHPGYLAEKSPDECPEGILADEDGKPYIQLVCRCKDMEVRALTAKLDEKYHLIWGSKDFNDDFPF
jgi:hypothetical protein